MNITPDRTALNKPRLAWELIALLHMRRALRFTERFAIGCRKAMGGDEPIAEALCESLLMSFEYQRMGQHMSMIECLNGSEPLCAVWRDKLPDEVTTYRQLEAWVGRSCVQVDAFIKTHIKEIQAHVKAITGVTPHVCVADNGTALRIRTFRLSYDFYCSSADELLSVADTCWIDAH